MNITRVKLRLPWRRYRLVVMALTISLLAHGATILLAPQIAFFGVEPASTRFSARLIPSPPEPQAITVRQPAPAPVPPRPRKKTPPVPQPIIEALVEIPQPLIEAPDEIHQSSLPPQQVVENAPAEINVSAPTLSAAPEPQSVAPELRGKPLDTLPSRIAIEYDLRSSLVDGRAEYVWRREGDQYFIDGNIEANGFFATMFVGRFEQSSRGRLTPAGLKPDYFSIRRGEGAAEFAEFKWDQSQIKHNRLKGEHIQPLQEGAQDLLSFIFQFAYEFPQKLAKPGAVSLRISNARKIDQYEFRVVGREKLSLPIGEVETVHLIRQTEEAADTYQVWLASDFNYLPVKLRFMLGGRVIVEQIAVSLTNTP